ncbi:hypothetical protein BN77_3413 [Rhizobium mesoamericanum STM3625]|uniref:Uncharacterized protein n=1 Tax=Rhizobium mesoamericanum STM3625 TaxID=1211777 RepID=K0Q1E0_9HYPH|nr:hypothetical protein BN77_3413 [Rhizobium mesoamericanum STM3625]
MSFETPFDHEGLVYSRIPAKRHALYRRNLRSGNSLRAPARLDAEFHISILHEDMVWFEEHDLLTLHSHPKNHDEMTTPVETQSDRSGNP